MWNTRTRLKTIFSTRQCRVIENADGWARSAPSLRDALTFYFKLDENGKIKDAKFQTFGCAAPSPHLRL